MEVCPALALAVLEVVVLQQAFAPPCRRSAADRTIDEQRLLDPGPGCLARARSRWRSPLPSFDRRLAAGHELGRRRDLAQWPRRAPPGPSRSGASGSSPTSRQPGMPAVARDLPCRPAARGLDAIEPFVGRRSSISCPSTMTVGIRCASTIWRAGTGSATVQPVGFVRLM